MLNSLCEEFNGLIFSVHLYEAFCLSSDEKLIFWCEKERLIELFESELIIFRVKEGDSSKIVNCRDSEVDLRRVTLKLVCFEIVIQCLNKAIKSFKAVSPVGQQSMIIGLELESFSEQIDGLFILLLFEQIYGHLIVSKCNLGFELYRFLLRLKIGIGSLQAL